MHLISQKKIPADIHSLLMIVTGEIGLLISAGKTPDAAIEQSFQQHDIPAAMRQELTTMVQNAIHYGYADAAVSVESVPPPPPSPPIPRVRPLTKDRLLRTGISIIVLVLTLVTTVSYLCFLLARQ